MLEIEGVSKTYSGTGGVVQALADVSFTLGPGETVGLVGESGCGKSTLAGCIQGLIASDEGDIRLSGQSLTGASRAQRRALRRRIGLVHQNPYAALDPRMRVDAVIAEPLVAVLGLRGAAVARRVEACLAAVDLGPDFRRRFPHQLSGGQRQRVAIARAVALAPELLILDEPTAALDVSVQARILNLLKDIQAQTGMGYLFITHNLAVVDYMAPRVLVMFRGRVIEDGPSATVFAAPAHPYTASLLAAAPRPDPSWRASLSLAPPAPFMAEGPGCAFASRCPRPIGRCAVDAPPLTPSRAQARAACFNPLSATHP